ncbi:ATP-dependent DNA ligase [Methanoplanus endosymbiosus]|uniref:DNA ligase n=1 Tax=Methanoplanus endosymbiosus TaxID=33865 RepID=A0A9E7PKM3_9EURY|nr:ATP-dependent DNA ligase [Methanoplanus endosymbiosus]UUX91630.1 ATP-dependent DNA ligase [Methanoplanus endosymbiosus]
MNFIDFSEFCNTLESISGRLEMIDLIAEKLPGLSDEDMPVFLRFITGRVFPDYSQDKIGIGPNHVYESVAYVIGKNRDYVIRKINSGGDVGKAVENLLAKKEQTSFFSDTLELAGVFSDFKAISEIKGSKSQKEKLKFVKRLFANAKPVEGRYLARIMLGEMRIGVGDGNIREAVAKAFSVPAALVEHAYQAVNDLGEVALLAKRGAHALEEVKIELFRPVKMMLAKQGTIADMIQEQGSIAAEFKYDGTRFQFHKKGDSFKIYSRKLEDVTNAIPDISDLLMNCTEHDVILDGEVIAIEDGKPMPFQYVLKRFRRKHDIEAHVEDIRLRPNVFDILLLDDESLIEKPFTERRKILEDNVREYVAPQIVSGDIAEVEEFYRNALDEGHEGIMVKSLSAAYTPGQRVREWIKIKPEVDTIDLAVIGAEWGEGKRAGLFGSFLLACRDENDELYPVSKVATGISDDMLAFIYDTLKESVISESGKFVRFEPETVFEVGYAEIQKSVNYESGYALRFPRFVRMRDDKGIDEIETISSINERFAIQNEKRGIK